MVKPEFSVCISEIKSAVASYTQEHGMRPNVLYLGKRHIKALSDLVEYLFTHPEMHDKVKIFDSSGITFVEVVSYSYVRAHWEKERE